MTHEERLRAAVERCHDRYARPETVGVALAAAMLEKEAM
jgi:hypothetical protein